LVVTDSNIFVLDLAAKVLKGKTIQTKIFTPFLILQIDQAADYLFPERRGLEYPAPFGRDATEEEAKIADLDGKTGASLKVRPPPPPTKHPFTFYYF